MHNTRCITLVAYCIQRLGYNDLPVLAECLRPQLYQPAPETQVLKCSSNRENVKSIYFSRTSVNRTRRQTAKFWVHICTIKNVFYLANLDHHYFVIWIARCTIHSKACWQHNG
jgi:hypothetical protein